MRVAPDGVAGVMLLAPKTPEFASALEPLLGRAPRELVAPAEPFSVIVANDSTRALAFLAVRFNMIGPRAKPYSVVHYSDTLRNPAQTDFLPGARRFVCAEPAYTALLLRREDTPHSSGRMNLNTLRRMLHIDASIDCVAFDDGQFCGPDSMGAFDRLAEEREREALFIADVLNSPRGSVEQLLLRASDDPADRVRRAIARKLLEGLQTGGPDEIIERATRHRRRIPVWR